MKVSLSLLALLVSVTAVASTLSPAPALETTETNSPTSFPAFVSSLSSAKSIDADSCYVAVQLSDTNKDLKLDRDEAVTFFQITNPDMQSLADIHSFSELPVAFIATFTRMACLCRSPDFENLPDSCCMADAAHIRVTYDTDYLKLLCGITEAAADSLRDKSAAPMCAPPPPPTNEPTLASTPSGTGESTAVPTMAWTTTHPTLVATNAPPIAMSNDAPTGTGADEDNSSVPSNLISVGTGPLVAVLIAVFITGALVGVLALLSRRSSEASGRDLAPANQSDASQSEPSQDDYHLSARNFDLETGKAVANNGESSDAKGSADCDNDNNNAIDEVISDMNQFCAEGASLLGQGIPDATDTNVRTHSSPAGSSHSLPNHFSSHVWTSVNDEQVAGVPAGMDDSSERNSDSVEDPPDRQQHSSTIRGRSLVSDTFRYGTAPTVSYSEAEANGSASSLSSDSQSTEYHDAQVISSVGDGVNASIAGAEAGHDNDAGIELFSLVDRAISEETKLPDRDDDQVNRASSRSGAGQSIATTVAVSMQQQAPIALVGSQGHGNNNAAQGSSSPLVSSHSADPSNGNGLASSSPTSSSPGNTQAEYNRLVDIYRVKAPRLLESLNDDLNRVSERGGTIDAVLAEAERLLLQEAAEVPRANVSPRDEVGDD